ncbi:MAG: tetratricopeptide repeat protein [Pseudomonadota bacterium]
MHRVMLFLVVMLMAIPAAHACFDAGLAAFEEGDQAAALAIWQPLAEAGDADAQNALGDMYLYGRGVPRDAEAAIGWYEQAAAQGHADAQNHLGVIYANGFGVDVDRVTAFMWWKLAAERGHEDAPHALSVLANRMTAAEIDEANTRAEAWSTNQQP